VSNQILCMTLGTAICARGSACTSSELDPSCATQFVKGCCTTATCGESSGSVYMSQLDQCSTEIASFDCDQLGLGHLPAACPAPGGH